MSESLLLRSKNGKNGMAFAWNGCARTSSRNGEGAEGENGKWCWNRAAPNRLGGGHIPGRGRSAPNLVSSPETAFDKIYLLAHADARSGGDGVVVPERGKGNRLAAFGQVAVEVSLGRSRQRVRRLFRTRQSTAAAARRRSGGSSLRRSPGGGAGNSLSASRQVKVANSVAI